MHRITRLLPLAAAIALVLGWAALAAPSATQAAAEKVGVCHVTTSPSNPFVFIQVSVNALPDHEAHGDIIGAESEEDCVAEPPLTDVIIDADGTATAGDGIPGAVDVFVGAPLSAFPVTNSNDAGLDMFDNDASASWTSGDDLHAEGVGACATAIRDGNHDLGLDCKVLDLDNSLFDGQQVDCDLEFFAVFTACPPPGSVTWYDADGDGGWDDGEDIVLDVNLNGVFD